MSEFDLYSCRRLSDCKCFLLWTRLQPGTRVGALFVSRPIRSANLTGKVAQAGIATLLGHKWVTSSGAPLNPCKHHRQSVWGRPRLNCSRALFLLEFARSSRPPPSAIGRLSTSASLNKERRPGAQSCDARACPPPNQANLRWKENAPGMSSCSEPSLPALGNAR